MPTLTASTNFTVANQAASVATLQLSVVPAGSNIVTGRGRLVHPSLGTLDYTLPPHEWTNLDGDLIIPPTWASSKTLTSTASTLWTGSLRDVLVRESWLPEAGLSMPMPMLRVILAFYLNPPDPALGSYIEWHPTYATANKFKAIIESVEVDGAPLKMTPLTKHAELVEFPITVSIRPVERIA